MIEKPGTRQVAPAVIGGYREDDKDNRGWQRKNEGYGPRPKFQVDAVCGLREVVSCKVRNPRWWDAVVSGRFLWEPEAEGDSTNEAGLDQ